MNDLPTLADLAILGHCLAAASLISAAIWLGWIDFADKHGDGK